MHVSRRCLHLRGRPYIKFDIALVCYEFQDPASFGVLAVRMHCILEDPELQPFRVHQLDDTTR